MFSDNRELYPGGHSLVFENSIKGRKTVKSSWFIVERKLSSLPHIWGSYLKKKNPKQTKDVHWVAERTGVSTGIVNRLLKTYSRRAYPGQDPDVQPCLGRPGAPTLGKVGRATRVGFWLGSICTNTTSTPTSVALTTYLFPFRITSRTPQFAALPRTLWLLGELQHTLKFQLPRRQELTEIPLKEDLLKSLADEGVRKLKSNADEMKPYVKKKQSATKEHVFWQVLKVT